MIILEIEALNLYVNLELPIKDILLLGSNRKKFQPTKKKKMNYPETVHYLTENTDLVYKDFFDFERKPEEEYFENVFKFYSGNLAHNKRFGVTPSFIAFLDKKDFYAKAKKYNKNYIILFGKELITKLFKWHNSYVDFGKIKGLEEFKLIEDNINFRLATLLEQAILLFTFYHEFAHLIQFASKDAFEREENLSGNCDFKPNEHIEEFDADIFSGFCIATHIFDFIKNYLKENLEGDKLNEFIAITIGGVMTYILSLPMCNDECEFYTKKSSHPHNSIRVNNISKIIIDQFKNILIQEGLEMSIDANYIHARSFMIMNNLLKHFGMTEILENFAFDMENNWSSIQEYIGELHQKTLEYKLSAINKWNSK